MGKADWMIEIVCRTRSRRALLRILHRANAAKEEKVRWDCERVSTTGVDIGRTSAQREAVH